MVGVLFRNFEWAMDDGRSGWSTECCTFVSVEDVRTGNFKQPKDKPLRKKSENNATENSLLIFDEIGRGTSTYDGLSIAWSVLEYVVDKTMCGAKALFATHYHELSELEGRLDGVVNYRVAVKEYGDTIVFLRKIVRGSADKSFGIQVAKLAGLPQQVLDRAKEVLSGLEDADVNTRDDIVLPVAENRQGNSDPLSAVIARLRKVSPETLTPIESMILLDELCRIVNGEAKCDED